MSVISLPVVFSRTDLRTSGGMRWNNYLLIHQMHNLWHISLVVLPLLSTRLWTKQTKICARLAWKYMVNVINTGASTCLLLTICYEQETQRLCSRRSWISSLFLGEVALTYLPSYAHDLLTAYMENCGFKVTRHYLGLNTAWKAEYNQGAGGRVIGINSEMDALPGLGHACGHNLIAISGVGVAIALKAALEAQPQTSAKVVLLGTPGNFKHSSFEKQWLIKYSYSGRERWWKGHFTRTRSLRRNGRLHNVGCDCIHWQLNPLVINVVSSGAILLQVFLIPRALAARMHCKV